MKQLLLIVSILLITFCVDLRAQDQEEDQHSEHSMDTHIHHNKHTLALYTAFTHIPGAYYEHETHEQRRGKFVPTFGLDYYYHLSPNFSTGIMIDFEFDHYYVSEGEDQLIRDNIWVAAIIGKYKVTKYLELFAGPGYEMERKRSEHEQESVSLWLCRTGIEFIVPIENHWSMAPSFIYDYKKEYHSYSFGLSILKSF